jgi:hypothetical protein
MEKLSDADWKKVTEAEKWPVEVTAHHLTGVLDVPPAPKRPARRIARYGPYDDR